jgi:hypothetical protein
MEGWAFCDPWLVEPFYGLHNFATLLTLLLCRFTFVTQPEPKTTVKQDISWFCGEIRHLFWANKYATGGPHDVSVGVKQETARKLQVELHTNAEIQTDQCFVIEEEEIASSKFESSKILPSKHDMQTSAFIQDDFFQVPEPKKMATMNRSIQHETLKNYTLEKSAQVSSNITPSDHSSEQSDFC